MISSIIHSVIIIHVTYSISEMPYQWTSSCPCLLISAPSHARVCARLQLPPDRSELRAGFQRRGQHDFPAPPQPCLAQKPVESSRWCLLATTLRGTTASGTSLSAHQPPAPSLQFAGIICHLSTAKSSNLRHVAWLFDTCRMYLYLYLSLQITNGYMYWHVTDVCNRFVTVL